MPVWYLRLVPALLGALLPVVVYYLMLEFHFTRWTAVFAAAVIIMGMNIVLFIIIIIVHYLYCHCQQTTNAQLKKLVCFVLSCFLKSPGSLTAHKVSGRVFLRDGLAYAMSCSPNLLLNHGREKSVDSEDRRL